MSEVQSVYVVDDDAAVRDSMSLMLSLRGYRASTFASAEDFLGTVRPDWSGCVLADLRMGGMSGLELQQHLARDFPALRVIILTAHGDVASARQAFLASAVDFIEKPFTAAQVLDALARAERHPPHGTPAVPLEVLARTKGLSPREAEVLALVVQGLHNRHMAERLSISPRTVEVHKARIMEKLGVANVVELVRLVDGAATG